MLAGSSIIYLCILVWLFGAEDECDSHPPVLCVEGLCASAAVGFVNRWAGPVLNGAVDVHGVEYNDVALVAELVVKGLV